MLPPCLTPFPPFCAPWRAPCWRQHCFGTLEACRRRTYCPRWQFTHSALYSTQLQLGWRPACPASFCVIKKGHLRLLVLFCDAWGTTLTGTFARLIIWYTFMHRKRLKCLRGPQPPPFMPSPTLLLCCNRCLSPHPLPLRAALVHARWIARTCAVILRAPLYLLFKHRYGTKCLRPRGTAVACSANIACCLNRPPHEYKCMPLQDCCCYQI